MASFFFFFLNLYITFEISFRYTYTHSAHTTTKTSVIDIEILTHLCLPYSFFLFISLYLSLSLSPFLQSKASPQLCWTTYCCEYYKFFFFSLILFPQYLFAVKTPLEIKPPKLFRAYPPSFAFGLFSLSPSLSSSPSTIVVCLCNSKVYNAQMLNNITNHRNGWGNAKQVFQYITTLHKKKFFRRLTEKKKFKKKKKRNLIQLFIL